MISTNAAKLTALVGLVAICFVVPADGGEASLLLTNISRIRALTPGDIERQPAVRIEAVVTLHVPSRSRLWVQSDQHGLSLFYRDRQFSVQPGDRVLVTGKVVAGENGAQVAPEEVKVLGRGKLPDAAVRTAAQLQTFADENRLVQIEDRVRRFVEHTDWWGLEMGAGTNRFWLELPKRTNDSIAELAGSTVRVRGVCSKGAFGWGDRYQPVLLLQSFSDLSILQKAAPATSTDPYSITVLPVSAVTREVAIAATNNSRVRVQGVVIDQRLGEHVVIRDQSGTIFVRSATMLKVPADEPVDVWGTPAWDNTRVYLRYATFRLVNSNALASALASNVPAERPEDLPLLTRAREIQGLSAERAAWKYPVRLRGVVTFYHRQRWQFFMQDATSGVYVSGVWNRASLRPGDLVEVTGTSGIGGSAPIVDASQVTILGTTALPEAQPATLFQLSTGQFDSKWVEIHGVVRSLSLQNQLLQLRISDPDGTIAVEIPADRAPTNLVDAVVRVRGVCSMRFNDRRQITGLTILAPSIENLLVEDPGAANPLDLPEQPIIRLTQFRSRETLLRRVKVSGVVTLCQSAQAFFIQDSSDAVQVVLSSAPKVGLKPGDRVVVSGFPALGDYGSLLRDAVVQVTEHGAVPEPQLLPPDHPLNPTLHNKWVQMEALMLHHTRVDRKEVLTLQLPGSVFEAHCLTSIGGEDVAPGSKLRVVGIYRVLVDESRVPNSFQVIVPSSQNIHVLEQSPWWNFKHTATVVGVMTVIVAATTLALLMMRRKVREQTASLKQSEMKFRSLVEESLVGVYIIQDGGFAYANPRLAEIFGYTAEEIVRTCKVETLVTKDDLPLVQDHIQRRVAGEASAVHYNFRGVRKDGSIVYMEVLGSRTEFGGKPAVLGTALDVTERRRAEAALAQASTLLETLLENSPDYIYFKDRESRFVRYSGSFAQLLNLSDVRQLVGKTDFDLFTEEHARPAYEDEQEIIRTGKPLIGKLEKETHRDGRTTWALTNKLPWRDKDGNVIGTFGISKDVTQIKETEHKLAYERELFQTLLDHFPDAIYFKDRECRFVRVSRSKVKKSLHAARGLYWVKHPSAQLPPYLASEDEFGKYIIGKSDFNTYGDELARRTYDDEQAIITSGNPVIGKLERSNKPDGSPEWLLITKMPWRDKDGQVIGTFGVSRDITAVKEAEERLAYEQDLFRVLVENLPDNIYFKDQHSRFVRVSKSKVKTTLPVARAMYLAKHPGAEEKNLPAHLASTDAFAAFLIGKTDFETFDDNFARGAFDEEQTIIRSGNPVIGKMEKMNDGRWMLVTKMPWRDKDGNIVGTFGVSRDITALKQAEAQLESVHQRLVETSRLAGMAEVATDVLHNVGNVLNSVNVSCSLSIDRIKESKVTSLAKVSSLILENRDRLGDFLANDPRGQQVPGYLSALSEHLVGEQTSLLKELEQLLKHIDHIKQIVSMQQSYAKVAGVVETISPTQLVEDALQINASALVRHDVHVCREFEEVPYILTEKHKVLQILVNLIRNAKYAMDEAKRPDKLLKVKIGLTDDQSVKIQIVDNGVGIPPENLTRIFSHGFTTRRSGHGFGLHSSALAVRDLGGSIQAFSEGTGKGAIFTLLLPSKSPAEAGPFK